MLCDVVCQVRLCCMFRCVVLGCAMCYVVLCLSVCWCVQLVCFAINHGLIAHPNSCEYIIIYWPPSPLPPTTTPPASVHTQVTPPICSIICFYIMFVSWTLAHMCIFLPDLCCRTGEPKLFYGAAVFREFIQQVAKCIYCAVLSCWACNNCKGITTKWFFIAFLFCL